MKCTQCGCKKLIKIQVPFWASPDANFSTDKTLAIYACFDCGHLEWFNISPVDTYKKNCAELETATTELKNLRTQLEELLNSDALKELTAESKSIMKEISRVGSTSLQGLELNSKLSKVKSKIREIDKEAESLRQRIFDLENIEKRLRNYFINTPVVKE